MMNLALNIAFALVAAAFDLVADEVACRYPDHPLPLSPRRHLEIDEAVQDAVGVDDGLLARDPHRMLELAVVGIERRRLHLEPGLGHPDAAQPGLAYHPVIGEIFGRCLVVSHGAAFQARR